MSELLPIVTPWNPVADYCQREKIGPTELAKRVGVSRQLANCWIKGNHLPSTRHIESLAKVIGLDPMQMIRVLKASRVASTERKGGSKASKSKRGI